MRTKIISIILCATLFVSFTVSSMAAENVTIPETTQEIALGSSSIEMENPESAFMESAISPYASKTYAMENGQNKNNWCWATTAAMVANRKEC